MSTATDGTLSEWCRSCTSQYGQNLLLSWSHAPPLSKSYAVQASNCPGLVASCCNFYLRPYFLFYSHCAPLTPLWFQSSSQNLHRSYWDRMCHSTTHSLTTLTTLFKLKASKNGWLSFYLDCKLCVEEQTPQPRTGYNTVEYRQKQNRAIILIVATIWASIQIKISNGWPVVGLPS